MTIYQKRQLNRFESSAAFIDARKDQFSASSKALTLRDELKEVAVGVSAIKPQPKATGAGKRASSSAKLNALNALRADLVLIANSAKVIADSTEGFNNTFILPDRRRKNDLADAARQFIKDATPIKGEFEALEMKPNFLEQLQERLGAYEAAQAAPSAGTAKPQRSGGSDAASEFISRGVKILDVLDVIVQNKYNGQEDVLESWSEASTLEFTPRRKKGERATEKAAKKAA
ncbi:MAG TPA: hypothetical protein VGB45_15290 [Abditibacterium sp.]|jgi:hypothetical protein